MAQLLQIFISVLANLHFGVGILDVKCEGKHYIHKLVSTYTAHSNIPGEKNLNCSENEMQGAPIYWKKHHQRLARNDTQLEITVSEALDAGVFTCWNETTDELLSCHTVLLMRKTANGEMVYPMLTPFEGCMCPMDRCVLWSVKYSTLGVICCLSHVGQGGSFLRKSTMEADSPKVRRRRRKHKHRISRKSKYNIFWKIHEQWKLLGFFEIKQDHEFYEFTCMLKEGLRKSVQDAIDAPSTTDVLNESHYTAVHKQFHEGFEMRTYAGPVFARLRQNLGMVDTEYKNSLSCESSYLQFISNSKSNADFFLTNDKRFFLKTQSKREIHFLLANLPKYIDHLESYPHSLLVKFLGVHSIIVPQEKKKYFIIMQSIFYPHERIVERYDIKGCQVGRWTNAAPEGSEIIMVFKDLNFEGNTISLGQQRDWFIHQVELDTQFLKELDVIDYSILVGLQPLHENERALNQTVANILARAALPLESSYHNMQSRISRVSEMEDDCVSSVMAGSSMEQLNNFKSFPGNQNTIQNLLTFYLMQRSSIDMPRMLPSGSEIVIQEILASQPAEVDGAMQDITIPSLVDTLPLSQNRRLLFSAKNPLHIIDGPDYRYFVGIIDLFTVYGFRKKLEHLWKSIRYRGQSFSTVNPSSYARRICQWVEEHTT